MIGLLILSALFAGAVELVCYNWRELSRCLDTEVSKHGIDE
jgi:hypothetical protein